MSSHTPYEQIAASLTHDRVAEIQEAFSLFDADGNGEISAAELGMVLRSIGQAPAESDIRRLLREVDKDESGTIDFAEFLLLMVRTPGAALAGAAAGAATTPAEEQARRTWGDSLTSGAPSPTAASAAARRGSVSGVGVVNVHSGALLSEFNAEEMLEPFMRADQRGTGWCAKDDFVRIMTTQGDALTADEVTELLETAVVAAMPPRHQDSRLSLSVHSAGSPKAGSSTNRRCSAPDAPSNPLTPPPLAAPLVTSDLESSSDFNNNNLNRPGGESGGSTSGAPTRAVSEYSLHRQLQGDLEFTRESSTALQVDPTGEFVNYRAFVTNLLHAAQNGSALFD